MTRKVIVVLAGVILAGIAVAGSVRFLLSANPICDGLRSCTDLSFVKLFVSLGTLEARLGPASTVPQLDGEATFFYWPGRGIAVFTHPHFGAQYRRASRSERKVTSIVVALRPEVHPCIPPVEDDLVIGMGTPQDLNVGGLRVSSDNLPRLEKLFRYAINVDRDTVEYSDSRISWLPTRRVFVHYFHEEPQVLEVRENRLFSWYD